jgi:GntR family phosphonate transport system transcriptional regulator
MTAGRPKGPVPRWRLVADALAREIAGGDHDAAEPMPSAQELARRFLVHRNTVNRAIQALRADGLVTVVRGRGAFVRETPVRYRLGPRSRLGRAVSEVARVRERSPLASGRDAASDEVAQALRLPRGAAVVHVDLLTAVDGRPMSLTSHFFPLPRFAGIDKAIMESLSITQALRRFGIAEYYRRRTTIFAQSPDAQERAALGLRKSEPLLVTLAVNYGPNGAPIHYLRARWAASLVRLEVEFPG